MATVEKSLMPNSLDASEMIKPSIFKVVTGAAFIMEENSSLVLKDDSKLKLSSNSKQIVDGDVILKDNSKFVLNGGVDFHLLHPLGLGVKSS